VGIQVRWDRDCTKPAGEYTFFYGKGDENHELDTFFVHKRIVPAVKRVEFVNDRLSYIILRGHWCDVIVLNVLASTEDKIDMKGSFYKELEHIQRGPKKCMHSLISQYLWNQMTCSYNSWR
jgi:hypothetical protein